MKKIDLYIYAAIIIFSGVIFCFMTITDINRAESVAVICEGQVVTNLDLSINKEIEINNVVIEILDGSARAKSSSCPDKICVKSGWIKNVNEQAVCLPNKVIIKIVGEH